MSNSEKIFSPYTGEELMEISFLERDEVSNKLTALNLAQKEWAKESKDLRIKVLQAFNQELIGRKDEIGRLISTYMGRPIRFTPNEVLTAASRSEEIIERYRELELEQIIDSNRMIVKIPRGNILVFGAWNYPVLTAINSIAPAIISGNGVSFRPSSQTHFMGQIFEKAFEKAGLPKNVFQVTSFPHKTTKEIVQSKNIHGLVYTGSTDGGRKIHQWAGGNFVPVTMELGGKDAAYVREDADLEHAAVNIADGAFFNSGQSCCGVERVYAHKNVYQKVLEILIKEGKKLTLGDPLNSETTLGPMAKKGTVSSLINQWEAAKKEGGKTHLDDLGKINPEGQFIRPEVITNVKMNSSIQQEETFGPFVSITPVESDEEAIQLINNSTFGLTASIWTKDSQAARQIAPQLEVGVVLVNRCDYVDPKLTWRGEKETGMGHALGPDCFSQYLKDRSILIQ